MADILHELYINAPADDVFAAISTPEGLRAWWTLRAEGTARADNVYTLDFGPGCLWKAVVTECHPPEYIEWKFVDADEDWTGTLVRLSLTADKTATTVNFAHTGWSEANQHFRVSSYCWAMYLRLLRTYAEQGHIVPYAQRLRA